MNNRNLLKLGGLCALLVALSYFIVGLAYLFLPAEQKGGTLLHDPEKFLLSMAQNSTLITIHHFSFGLGALLAIAVVMARSAIQATNYFVSIDPHMWLGYGLVGIWIFTISFVALRQRIQPRMLGLLGIAGGLLYFFIEFGTILNSELLITLAAGIGAMIVGPLWYGWVGWILRKKETADRVF